jgi:hypothetical protein
MSMDFAHVSELDEFAAVTSLDEIGCGSMAVSYYDMFEDEIVQDVLRDNPEMSNVIYAMTISHELVVWVQ